MRSKRSTYAWKILWVVGLFALAMISFDLEKSVREHAQMNLEIMNLYWFFAVVPFLFGIYIALLFVKIQSFKLDFVLLLCVAVPCFIIAFYIPVMYTIFENTIPTSSSLTVPIPFWLIKINSLNIFSIVAGLTLMLGLFRKTKSYEV